MQVINCQRLGQAGVTSQVYQIALQRYLQQLQQGVGQLNGQIDAFRLAHGSVSRTIATLARMLKGRLQRIADLLTAENFPQAQAAQEEAEEDEAQEEEEEAGPQVGGQEPEGPEEEDDEEEEPRLSAKEFEKRISKMPASERVAEVKKMAERVAREKGLKTRTNNDELARKYSKMNGREVYRKADHKGRTEELYSPDTQHGRFEVCDKNGKHLREVDFDFNQTKGPDLSGRHNLKVK